MIERESRKVKELLKSILQRIIEEMEEEFRGFREESITPGLRNRSKQEKEVKREDAREREIERYLDIIRRCPFK